MERKPGSVAHLVWRHRFLLIWRDDKEGICCPNKWDSLTEELESDDKGFLGCALRGLEEEIGIIPKCFHGLGVSRGGNGIFFGILSDAEREAIVFGSEGKGYDFVKFRDLPYIDLGDALRFFLEAYPEVFRRFAEDHKIPCQGEMRLTDFKD